jgi:hypothetical protein
MALSVLDGGGVMLLVAKFSSSPSFGLFVVHKAVLHKTPFYYDYLC